jgi:hypothetical protein
MVDQIDDLSRQIIKYRYAKEFYHIDIFEKDFYYYKLCQLKRIEDNHSNLKASYSPSNRLNFNLLEAQKVFGVNEWDKIEKMFKAIFVVNSINNAVFGD